MGGNDFRKKIWCDSDKIHPQYAHERMYDGMTQNIPSKDTIVSLPEEKVNSCQRDREC